MTFDSTRAVPRALLLACLLLAGVPAAWAQQPLGPSPVIAGVQVQCGGVPTFVQPIGDIALATGGAIVLNPQLFKFPGAMQLFVYAHECAHHILGPNENTADCWAIRTGRQQGWFKARDVTYLIQYFGGSPGDWTHAPGPVRVGNMMACFQTARHTLDNGDVFGTETPERIASTECSHPNCRFEPAACAGSNCRSEQDECNGGVCRSASDACGTSGCRTRVDRCPTGVCRLS